MTQRIVRRLAFVATALCAGCATAPSDPGPICGRLVTYPRDVQERAAAEIEARTAPTLARFSEDYGELRAAVRGACSG